MAKVTLMGPVILVCIDEELGQLAAVMRGPTGRADMTVRIVRLHYEHATACRSNLGKRPEHNAMSRKSRVLL